MRVGGVGVVQARSDGGEFGDVVIEHTESSVATWLESDASRVFRIERSGPRTRKNVPIGTRDGNFLTADLGGEPVTIRPGSGRIVRRSYRVMLEFGSRTTSLSPKDLTTCRVLNGHPREIENEFALLTAYRDGSVGLEWAYPVRIPIMRRTITPPEPEADDILIGCGAAAAFGTGSLSLTSIVMGLVSSVFPT
ncbi:hypothetical protein [Nocardia macrotermitis]|uniref:Uncharacterized protein n=1 Tax=Nocardia macrotermitis TaxID=2585198 RepID=A0A7K0D1B3_9NOCA|nr:hypothetical protein [Nocardia macrotermitis]MQY19478.1 hypothetical protein [Nocardia macrotermitis]